MNLAEIASEPVVSVAPGDALDKAISLMEEHGIHHLPVVLDGSPVGMISDRDLLLGVGWMLGSERRIGPENRRLAGPASVAEVMSSPALTLSPASTICAAASLMRDHHIGAIPLMKEGTLVGVVTKVDLLRRLATLPRARVGGRMLEDPVERHMRAKVYTAAPSDSILTIVELMHDRRLRHVPIVVDGAVVGMVSDRDIRRAWGVDRIEDERAQEEGRFYLGASRAVEIMSKHVRTIPSSATMRAAATIMGEERIGSLPVLRDERLIGIITDTDMVRLLSRMDE